MNRIRYTKMNYDFKAKWKRDFVACLSYRHCNSDNNKNALVCSVFNDNVISIVIPIVKKYYCIDGCNQTSLRNDMNIFLTRYSVRSVSIRFCLVWKFVVSFFMSKVMLYSKRFNNCVRLEFINITNIRWILIKHECVWH